MTRPTPLQKLAAKNRRTRIELGEGPHPRLRWWYVLDGGTHSVSGFNSREAARIAAMAKVRRDWEIWQDGEKTESSKGEAND